MTQHSCYQPQGGLAEPIFSNEVGGSPFEASGAEGRAISSSDWGVAHVAYLGEGNLGLQLSAHVGVLDTCVEDHERGASENVGSGVELVEGAQPVLLFHPLGP